jgi:hypothetical protein
MDSLRHCSLELSFPFFTFGFSDIPSNMILGLMLLALFFLFIDQNACLALLSA